jgi:hypothetical protein
MDNTIVYTLSIPLFFGIFCGYVNYFNCLYVSNTKLIIRQSEQIQFILGRMIELEKKIKSLKLDADLNEQVQDDELDKVLEEDLNEVEYDELDKVIEEDLNEVEYDELDKVIEEEEEQSQCLEKDFELVETSSTFKINKNNGWLRFIF